MTELETEFKTVIDDFIKFLEKDPRAEMEHGSQEHTDWSRESSVKLDEKINDILSIPAYSDPNVNFSFLADTKKSDFLAKHGSELPSAED